MSQSHTGREWWRHLVWPCPAGRGRRWIRLAAGISRAERSAGGPRTVLRSSYTMRTKCAISDGFVRDCAFAYCASVAQYVYSLSAEHYFRLRNSAISDERVRDCALSTHSVFRPLSCPEMQEIRDPTWAEREVMRRSDTRGSRYRMGRGRGEGRSGLRGDRQIKTDWEVDWNARICTDYTGTAVLFK